VTKIWWNGRLKRSPVHGPLDAMPYAKLTTRGHLPLEQVAKIKQII